MKLDKRTIAEETSHGDFSRFDRLTEQERASIMQTWTKDTWDKFRMQNTITEEEVFDAVFKIIENG